MLHSAMLCIKKSSAPVQWFKLVYNRWHPQAIIPPRPWPLLCRIPLPSVSPILLLSRPLSGPPVDKFGLAHPVSGFLGCWCCLYYYYCHCFFLLSGPVGYRLCYPACDSELFLGQHIGGILAEIYTLSPDALFLRMQSIARCGQSRTSTWLFCRHRAVR